MEIKDKLYIHYGLLGIPAAAEINVTGEDIEYIKKSRIMDWMDERYAAIYGSTLKEHEGARMVLQSLRRYINSL